MQLKIGILAVLFVLFGSISYADCLTTPVDLKCAPCTIEEALDKLESQINCSFSYSSDQLNPDQSINLSVSQMPLIQVLEKITQGKFNIKQRSRYILMTPKKTTSEEKPKKKEYIVEGYVRDAKSGIVISNASIYAVGDKSAVISNSNGFYRLNLETDKESIGLSYSRQSYFDTIIVIKPIAGITNKDIRLEPREAAPEKMPIRTSVSTRPKEVEELTMVKFLVPEPQRQFAVNLDFLENIPVQISLLPSIGTNKFTSGAKSNLLSVNVLAGYNAGVEGLEVGGLVNINREDMMGLQAAGVSNIVGGKVRGIQAGGVFNNVRGSVYGLQAAGVYNIVLDTVKGAQAAGVFNVLRGTIQGTQLSGLFNVATENMTGLQAAGFSNHTIRDVKFAQAAGFMNTAGTVSGAQVAGFMNISMGEVKGTQVSGFMNLAKNITGAQVAGFLNASGDATTQISGFMNVGKKIDGLQLGVFNFSDTTHLSLGFLSFSLKGMNHIDFHSDLIQPYNLSYRTGSRHFYNILQAVYGSYVGLGLFSYGYGIGSEIGPNDKRIHLNLELLARQIVDINNEQSPLNLNVHLDPTLNVRIGKKRPAIVFGPTLNAIISTGNIQNQDPDVGKTMSFRDSYPPIYDELDGTYDVNFWIGAKLGIRI